MSLPSVAKAPASYDAPTLDGMLVPGVTELDGGEASERIADQQQPLMKGANTVVRGTNNAVLTYTVHLGFGASLAQIDADLTTWTGTWIPMFMAGRAQTPKPRVYTLVDLRAPWVKRAIFEKLSPQKTEKPGGPWSWQLVLHEYNRVAPYGGPLQPPDALDAQILANTKTIDALSGQLAGPVAASKTYNPNSWRTGGT